MISDAMAQELTMKTDREEFNARIMVYGNSLAIKVTEQAKRMGLGRYDIVKVTIERIPGAETPEEE